MADFTGKTQSFVALKCAVEHEAEADRFFALHADWIERTHPKEGNEALLQYTVSKSLDGQGSVLFLLSAVFATPAGVANHHRLGQEDDEGSARIQPAFRALLAKCETISSGASEVVHSLW